MAGDKSEEFEQDESFEDSTDNDEVAKAAAVKNTLIRRREIDDVLEERKLQRRLRDYDFDLRDEK